MLASATAWTRVQLRLGPLSCLLRTDGLYTMACHQLAIHVYAVIAYDGEHDRY